MSCSLLGILMLMAKVTGMQRGKKRNGNGWFGIMSNEGKYSIFFTFFSCFFVIHSYS